MTLEQKQAEMRKRWHPEEFTTYNRAVVLLQQRPMLSYSVIARELHVSPERIRVIARESGEGLKRNRDSAKARKLQEIHRPTLKKLAAEGYSQRELLQLAEAVLSTEEIPQGTI